MSNTLLWQPSQSRRQKTAIYQFQQYVEARYQKHFTDYCALHQWSINHPNEFWKAVWDYCQITASHPPKQILQPGKTIKDARWFEAATLNFAENCLKHDVCVEQLHKQ